ncbi:MAG: molybdopterin-guanine dinucleotide biosynthesis protein B [Anaerolineae bacterium]
MCRAIPVLVITGYSGSGKTTLIERLIAALGRRGYNTGVVKHSWHAAPLGQTAKDSERFMAGGAAAVALMGPASVSLEWPASRAPDLQALANLMPVDLVLAEGFKAGTGARVIVFGDRPQSVAELSEGREVIAVVGDRCDPDWPWPCCGRDDVTAVADRVETWLREQ